ncbi:ribonuclease III [Xylariomycetidae sp. FL0641]|nr:ribonuclease III [Xylariomycetidae sp. FL0641]
MSKRSYREFSDGGDSLSRITKHVDELLRATQALKQDLETLRRTNGDHKTGARDLLQHHKISLLPAAQALVGDEILAPLMDNPVSQGNKKIQLTSHASSQRISALEIPPPTSLTAWAPVDAQGSGLPPLTPVMDPILEQAALTHAGMVQHPGEMNYERLEWLGDAYLYLISTAFIYQTFPDLTTGRSAQLRERLVKNETLASYTVQYGINERTRFPSEFDLRGRIGGSQASQKQKMKVLGDVFEAYVAAAILSDTGGLTRVADWLKAVWARSLKDEITRQYRGRPPVALPPNPNLDGSTKSTATDDSNDRANDNAKKDLNPKVLLAQAVGAKGVKISYRDMGEPKKEKTSKLPWYTVGVFYDGLGETNLQLGYGGALSKKEAGANAAVQALENKKQIKRLQKKKEEVNAALQLGTAQSTSGDQHVL